MANLWGPWGAHWTHRGNLCWENVCTWSVPSSLFLCTPSHEERPPSVKGIGPGGRTKLLETEMCFKFQVQFMRQWANHNIRFSPGSSRWERLWQRVGEKWSWDWPCKGQLDCLFMGRWVLLPRLFSSTPEKGCLGGEGLGIKVEMTSMCGILLALASSTPLKVCRHRRAWELRRLNTYLMHAFSVQHSFFRWVFIHSDVSYRTTTATTFRTDYRRKTLF